MFKLKEKKTVLPLIIKYINKNSTSVCFWWLNNKQKTKNDVRGDMRCIFNLKNK